MLLKSLEIFGFKSFANRTKIDFSDGITALLGPNGCGKSNVVESIKWVLGEQSSKSLRSKKMADVIFKGTQDRAALNVAEVKLTIDNHDNMLPLDFPEISVKRRIHRSGENEYYINDALVTLREIRELFFDTGMGKSAYSVIEQGQIDRILSNKPEDRRYIFEEAAGITKFKARKAEAERKLEKTTENLSKIEIELKEVSKSYENLKVQAEKVEKHKSYSVDLFNLDVNMQLLKARDLTEQKNKKQKKYDLLISEKIKIEESIKELENKLKDNIGNIDYTENELENLQRRLNQLKFDRQTHNYDIQRVIDSKANEQEKIVEIKEKELTILDKINSIDEQIQQKNEILQEFDKNLSKIDDDISNIKTQLEDARELEKNNTETIKSLQNRIIESELSQKDYNFAIKDITDDIVVQLDEGLKKSNFSNSEKQKIEKEIIRLTKEIESAIDKKAILSKELSQIDNIDNQELKTIADSLNSSFIEIKMNIDKLKKAIFDYGGMYPNFLNDFLSPEGIITKKRTLDSKIEELHKQIDDDREIVRDKQEENRILAVKIEQFRAKINDNNLSIAKLKTQRDAFEDQLNRDLKDKENFIKEKNGLQSRIEAIKKNIKDFDSKIETMNKEKKIFDEQIEKTQKEYEKNSEKLKKGNSSLQKIQDNIDNSNKKILLKNDSIAKINSELITIGANINNIYENFFDKHNRDLKEFNDKMFEINDDPAKLKDKYNKLKDKLKSLGYINHAAPQEFEDVKERYDFLNEQMTDLKTAINSLEEITKKINQDSTELFLEAFNKIKRNFKKIFRRLFGGGVAEITLTDPKNILESGIEILAEPPGLKLQSIALLSGGQRSMTSVALIFAIFMVKPSPFCLLDEIDAALDEANIGRFISVLNEFAERSQFIVISHNKKTVTVAKTLLGVTMPEDGISSMISLNIANGISKEDDKNIEEMLKE